ncbi:hypothetical protein EAO69_29485 [Streptomyces sp. me109]|nr:hypothetical protein EAO69_29485 [Streptomyces sp. me109]
MRGSGGGSPQGHGGRGSPPRIRRRTHPARPAFEDEALQAGAGVWGRQPPDTGRSAQPDQ